MRRGLGAMVVAALAVPVGVAGTAGAAGPDAAALIRRVVRADALRGLAHGDQRVIVRLRGDSITAQPATAAARFGLRTVGHVYRNVAAFSARLSYRQAEQLATSGDVMSIELDAPITVERPHPLTLDNAGPYPVPIRTADPGIGAAATAFHLDGDTAHDGAKTYSKGDSVIALIDTGIDATHPDLDGGKVLAFKNFVTSPSPSCAPPPSATAPFDDVGHGTHVASIAAGEGDGNADEAGVAPAAAIVALKIFDCTGVGTESDAAAAIDWMITNRAAYGIDVANMSFGTGPSDGTDILSVLTNQATAAGIITVAAAGNSGPYNGSVDAPGTARYALTVGAGRAGSGGRALADFSSRGPTVDGRIKPDVIAPGVDIDAAWANHSVYRYLSGTSMAAPVLSGLAALALQANPALRPSGTACSSCADGVVDSSMKTPFNDLARARAHPWGVPGPDNDSGYGFTDAYPLLAAAAGQPLTGGPAYPLHAVRTGHLDEGQSAVWPIRISDASQRGSIALTMAQSDIFNGPFFNAVVVDAQGNQVSMQQDWAYSQFDGGILGLAWFFGITRSTHLYFQAPAAGTYFVVLTANTGGSDYLLDFDGFAGVGASGTPLLLTVARRAAEGGTAGRVAVAFGAAPSAATGVRVYGDSQLSAPTTTLNYTTGNWSTPQSLDVPAVDDTKVEGLHEGRVFAVTSPGTPFARVAASVPSSLPIVDNDGPPESPHIERVSVQSGGYGSFGPINGLGTSSAITPDGAVVAFDSRAPDLAPGDTDGPQPDVFVHDRRTGATERVSVGPTGEASDPATLEGISDDGTRVLFSTSSALTPGDTNGDFDVYLRDRVTGTTTRVNLGTDGTEMPARSCRPGCLAIPSSLSGDGRYIAFATDAPMVPGDTNGTSDVYRRDLVTGAVTRVSVSSSGAQGTGTSGAGYVTISRDGSRVLFESNLAGLTPGERAGATDVFVHDMKTGKTSLVDTNGSGTNVGLETYRDPVMSPNGHYAMFPASDAGPSFRLMVKNLDTGAVRIANKLSDGSVAEGTTVAQGISDDGNQALLYAESNELLPAPGYGTVLRDIGTGALQFVPETSDGRWTSGGQISMSATGRFAGFSSNDDSVVSGDTNGNADMYLRVMSGTGNVAVVTSPRAGDQWTAGSTQTVRWHALAPSGTTATIQLVTPSGTTTIASGVPAEQESYSWTVPSGLAATTAATVKVTLGGYTASSAAFTIAPASTPPVASVGGASFYEGDASTHVVDFAVTLSQPANSAVQLNYSVSKQSGDTATPGSDFVAATGTLTLQPIYSGKTGTVAYIPVTVNGDTTTEPNETFTVQLTSASGATIGRAVPRATISNDDPQSGLKLYATNAGIVEGNAVATVGGANTLKMHVSLSRPVPSGHTVTVQYVVVSGTATGGSGPGAGIDFVATTSPVTLTFTAGQNDKTVSVKVFADTTKEPDETFSLKLANPTGASILSATGTGTIRNDD